jgi:hypothetical protein
MVSNIVPVAFRVSKSKNGSYLSSQPSVPPSAPRVHAASSPPALAHGQVSHVESNVLGPLLPTMSREVLADQARALRGLHELEDQRSLLREGDFELEVADFAMEVPVGHRGWRETEDLEWSDAESMQAGGCLGHARRDDADFGGRTE